MGIGFLGSKRWEKMNRLTVMPPVIKNAKSIFILAPGINKAKIMKEAQQNTSDIDNLPVLLAQNPIWCLD
jgi:6-phosphogluconolactonase/glucosamine-6-phosphate isomerase/deaminase